MRKFSADGQQPRDPDEQPDTSFLAKIPADTAFTFQTLDRRGLLLNTSQTWHQLRPGEIRHDCGGCHAHSQQPTDFSLTAAARPDYPVWDLINTTPLLTTKPRDESGKKWDTADATGLRLDKGGAHDVEYWRDIKPILERSGAACHSAKAGGEAAGKLDLDADDQLVPRENSGKFPGTYFRLALDERAQFGHQPVGYDSWGYPNASRYVRKLQSRRSLLVWKIFGERLDGFTNDDHPSEPEPGAGYFAQKGQRVPTDKARSRYDLDFLGKQMPPPDAVSGAHKTPDGRAIKIAPLTDEDRLTLVRWIDLGCPIDLDHAAVLAGQRGRGWFLDDLRPTLTLTAPAAGANATFSRILLGAHDFYSGLDPASLTVTADFPINGHAPGENLAPHFQPQSQGVWELTLTQNPAPLARANLVVSVKDKQGNLTRIERAFSVGPRKQAALP